MDSDRKNPLDWKPRRVEGILRQEADGMAVLLELKSWRYYSLNATGSRIWDLCDGTRSGADIARQLQPAMAPLNRQLAPPPSDSEAQGDPDPGPS